MPYPLTTWTKADGYTANSVVPSLLHACIRIHKELIAPHFLVVENDHELDFAYSRSAHGRSLYSTDTAALSFFYSLRFTLSSLSDRPYRPRRRPLRPQLPTNMQAFRLEPDEPAQDEPGTTPRLSPTSLPQTEHLPEVSMVEAADVTGVTFSPEYVVSKKLQGLLVELEADQQVVDAKEALGIRGIEERRCPIGMSCHTPWHVK